MPTTTFFNLPEEKRQRLIEAAWGEFVNGSFSEVSINQIIRNAGIPRGSFYQYFSDKEDLFFYLLNDLRRYFEEMMEELLTQAGGDLFGLTTLAFDELLQKIRNEDPGLIQFIRVNQMNRGLDLQRVTREKCRFLTDGLWSRTKLDGFISTDRDEVEHVFFLLIMALTAAVMEALREPDQLDKQRNRLKSCIEIIRAGSTVRRQEGGALC